MSHKEPQIRDLYIGYFNFKGQLFIERAYAFSEKQAKMLLVRRIAKKLSRDPMPLFCEFNGQKDNFSVKKEFEFAEEN